MMFTDNLSTCSSSMSELTFEDLADSIGEVRHLAVVTTDNCQARCAHCLMKSGPSRLERVDVDLVKQTVTYFATNSKLKLVAFTGGESTLLGDDLLEMIAHCTESGIATRLVTNAIWADTVENAVRMIRSLRSVGLTEINFSTDDFHRVWIPLENIRNAWNAAKGMGFTSVLVATCSGKKSKISPEYMVDYLGGEASIIDELKNRSDLPPQHVDGTRYMVSRSPIGRLGRGSRLREDLLPPFTEKTKHSLYGGCTGTFNPPTLNADGTLGLCCGINTEYNPILSLGSSEDLVRTGKYSLDETKKVILNAIRIIGPAQLLHIATGDPNIIEDRRFRSICEVCEYLTTDPKLVQSMVSQIASIARITSATLRAQTSIGGDDDGV